MEKLLTLKNNIPILIIKLTKKNSLLKKKQIYNLKIFISRNQPVSII